MDTMIQSQVITTPSTSSKKKHVCTFESCGREFSRLEHLKRHVRSHTGERPFQCVVTGCHKTFSRYDNMLQHARCHNPKETDSTKFVDLQTTSQKRGHDDNSSSSNSRSKMAKVKEGYSKQKQEAIPVEKSTSQLQLTSSPSMSDNSSNEDNSCYLNINRVSIFSELPSVSSLIHPNFISPLSSVVDSLSTNNNNTNNLNGNNNNNNNNNNSSNSNNNSNNNNMNHTAMDSIQLDKLRAAATLLSFKNDNFFRFSSVTELLSGKPDILQRL